MASLAVSCERGPDGGGGLRAGSGGGQAAERAPQSLSLQAARPQRERGHPRRQRARRGQDHQGRQEVPRPGPQLQPGHHLQG